MIFNKRYDSQTSLLILVTALLIIGIGLTLHRHLVYEVPLFYGETQTVWSVEAKVEFTAHGDPVKVSLSRPGEQVGFAVLNEAGASPGYGLNFSEGKSPKAEWTVRAASGRQELFYRADVLVTNQALVTQAMPAPPIKSVSWQEPYESAISEVLSRAYNTSADNHSLTKELLKQFEGPESAQHIELLKTHFNDELPELIVDMLHKANVPARIVYALELRDGQIGRASCRERV